jgi:nitric oxide reductase subunit B
VAHAMGATIGINSMLLLASVFYILKTENRTAAEKYKKITGAGLLVTNISLLVFWISLLGSGIIKIIGKTNNKGFYEVMQQLQPWFRIFSFSGIVMMAGLALILLAAFRITRDKTGSLQQTAVKKTVTEQAALISE